MTYVCQWCEEKAANEMKDKVYWELPDGTNAIEITEVPSFKCGECGIVYQTDEQVKERVQLVYPVELFCVCCEKSQDKQPFWPNI